VALEEFLTDRGRTSQLLHQAAKAAQPTLHRPHPEEAVALAEAIQAVAAAAALRVAAAAEDRANIYTALT
jgi:hypothetical protein